MFWSFKKCIFIECFVICVEYSATMQNRLYWKWEEGMDMDPNGTVIERSSDPKKAPNAATLVAYIEKKQTVA